MYQIIHRQPSFSVPWGMNNVGTLSNPLWIIVCSHFYCYFYNDLHLAATPMVGFEGFGKPKTDRICSRRAFDSCGVSEIFRFADLSGERKGEHQKGESARTLGRCSQTNETILFEKIKGRGVWIRSIVFICWT